MLMDGLLVPPELEVELDIGDRNQRHDLVFDCFAKP